MNTIRGKILFIMGLMILSLIIVLAFISGDIFARYKYLALAECSAGIDHKAEEINKNIRRLEENAKSLATIGKVNYEIKDTNKELTDFTIMAHFRDGAVGIGGGIWYEPFMFDKSKKYSCAYAFNDGKVIKIDEGYESERYDYPNQSWYISVKSQVKKTDECAWTSPYFDEQGTLTLMTTVGAGIFDDNNKFVGMSTADWKINSIINSISKIKPSKNSFTLFADVNSDFILALTDINIPDNAVGQSLKTIPWYNAKIKDKDYILYNDVRYISFNRQLDNGMLIIVNVPEEEFFAEINSHIIKTISAVIIISLLLAGITYGLLHKFVSKPIKSLSEKAEEIGAGNFDTEIEISGNDEIGKLAQSFNKMTSDIKNHILNLKNITAEKQRIATELDLAHEIQTSLLPSIFPPYPDRKEFDIYAFMTPAKEVGGDFFDFFIIDNKRLAVIIADVSDKGVPAALFVMITKTLIKNFALLNLSPEEIFKRTNEQLCENNELGMFVTSFMGFLDIESGEFSYVNAGHNPPYISQNGKDFKELPLPKGLILAGLEGSEYTEMKIKLNKGDKLFLYTDGVTEAFNNEKELFSEARLEKTLNENKEKNVKELLVQVHKSISYFTDGAAQSDDITMLGLSYNGEDTDS